MDLTQLQQEYATCQRCPALCSSRRQVVFGSGNPTAHILFIGEAPGAQEDAQGIPFCGASGKVLQELLASINLTRDDVFITNTILCRPENNRNPAKEEVENCRTRLDQLITIMKPKVIVTIGNFATERILGKKGITSLRGKIFPLTINSQEVNVIPVIHPANLLYSGRNPKIMRQMKDDFQLIKSALP
ncbi:MAG TPA: uracil-DNA glycosylase [Candidatus Nanoarchaeia archaeon]|nr:uracil-DNA glycosylase [Candidatus Nanoarchaeia archaeon]